MGEGVGREERGGKVGKRGEEERRRGERKLGGTEIKSLEPLMHSKLPTTYGLPVHALSLSTPTPPQLHYRQLRRCCLRGMRRRAVA